MKKIRKAKKDDLKEIGKLMLKEFSKAPFNEDNSLSSVLKSLNFYFRIGKIYITLEDKKIIGVIVFKEEQYWEGLVIIIEDLAIDENFQKQGIGKKLLNHLDKYSKKRKVSSINFITNKKSRLINFYKKLGYKINKNRVYFEKK